MRTHKKILKTLIVTTAVALLAAGTTRSYAAETAPAANAMVKPAVAPEAVQPAAPKGYTVAVLPFSYSTKDKAFEDMGSEVQELMTAYLTANPSLILVERAEVDKALSEVELGKSGTVDPDTAAKVGHLTGAQVLVTGRIFPVQNDIVMVAKIIGIETGRVYGVTETFPASGKITASAQDLSQKVGDNIAEKGETMIAHVENKEDIIAKLKPKLAGLKLPSISIEIAEKDVNHEIVGSVKVPGVSLDIDHKTTNMDTMRPATETEMGYILKQLGFEVVDIAESNHRADIEVSGDAFSEFALRKGNLVSVKGRAEIKAIRKSDGKVLAVDRQESVAVDLAPEIAGKDALAKAAGDLTERLVETIISSLKQ